MNDIRILIAKDLESDISAIEEVIKAEGYPFDVVSEFDEVRRKTSAVNYSMVLYLPPPPGRPPRGVWKYLNEYLKNIPLVFCAPPDYTVDDYAQWLEFGMGYYLSLPITKSQLLSAIHAVVESKEIADVHGAAKTVLPLPGGRNINDVETMQLGRIIMSSFENCEHHQKVLKKTYRKNQIIEEAALFTGTASLRTKERMQREEELIEAIEQKQFEMFYQPIVSLEEGRIAGFEALMRWRNPQRGFVSPSEFIPLAEETGLIIPLGLLAVEMTVRQLCTWNAGIRKNEPVTSSVNLSTVQFINPLLADQIEEIVEAQHIPHELLRFEITESAIMADMESANIMLLKLKSKKHKLYMDDFGTGYSSLSYLRHFPVDVLKIDQSFVKWMGLDEESDTIVKTIIELAHNLHMEVVAEGVETEEHLALLRKMNCDYGQGYLFAKPLDVEAAAELLLKDPVW